MNRWWIAGAALLLFVGLPIYHLSTADVKIDPQAWESPENPGLAGVFSPNPGLMNSPAIDIGPHDGPETIIQDPGGQLIVGTSDGHILRIDPKDGRKESLGQTGGHPLGLTFDGQRRLIVADAMKGILRLVNGEFESICVPKSGGAVGFADAVVATDDGFVYFTDATSRFPANLHGGAYEASRLEISEHRGSGRLIRCHPERGEFTILKDGLVFANGLTLSHDKRYLLLVETGKYQILRHWLKGPRAGRTLNFLTGLPGFPDNISRGSDGSYWVGLVSPRNPWLDMFSGSPGFRKMFFRLPRWMQPDIKAYGHVVQINAAGEAIRTLQDPTGAVGFTTGVAEGEERLYISRLRGSSIPVINKSKLPETSGAGQAL